MGTARDLWRGGLVLAAAALAAACMPASWGAGALLHPYRHHAPTRRPGGARDVVIQGDGVRLTGWSFRSERPSRGTVIYLHGVADNRASGVYIAERFLRQGFDALIYDSRAHGDSEGDACTYGYYEKRDLSRAIDTLDAKPVIVIGVSLGGAVALQAAALDPRIAAVVAVSAFSDLRTVARERAPFVASQHEIDEAFALAEKEGRFRIDDVSPVAAAPRIHVPVLLVHGAADRETFPAHSERILAALGGPKRLLSIPGAGHNDALRPEVWTTIDAFIDGVVPPHDGRP